MRGTVDVVTSLCAHPTATCARRGRVSPPAQRQGTRGQKCPTWDAESSALLASETAVGQMSGEFDNYDLPSSASGEDHALHAGFGASVHHAGKRRQQRNREGSS